MQLEDAINEYTGVYAPWNLEKLPPAIRTAKISTDLVIQIQGALSEKQTELGEAKQTYRQNALHDEKIALVVALDIVQLKLDPTE